MDLVIDCDYSMLYFMWCNDLLRFRGSRRSVRMTVAWL